MSTKVTFTLDREIVGSATEGVLVGDFNNWNPNEGIGLEVQKDGSLKATVSLEPGQTYRYRYYLNDGRWVNDGNADYYAFDPIYQVDNCVITIPENGEGRMEERNIEAITQTETKTIPTPEAVVEEAKAGSITEVEAESVAKAEPRAETKADDLTKIDGIGKKLAEVLQGAGIQSFEDLAKASKKKLGSILEKAGSKFKSHDPSTWSKQAKLAAAGKWDALKSLQKELKAAKKK